MSGKENMYALFEEWRVETFELKLRGHGRSGYDAINKFSSRTGEPIHGYANK